MNDLAQAIAVLESVNLAHGDLRPENVLPDRDRLKLFNFGCTAKIGTKYESSMAPYGRVLNNNESDQDISAKWSPVEYATPCWLKTQDLGSVSRFEASRKDNCGVNWLNREKGGSLTCCSNPLLSN